MSFGNVGIFAYDFSGKLLWSSPVQVKPTRYGWGTAASPVLHNGRLYIVNDNDGGSYLTAVDAATGKTIWLVERKEGTNWATPYIWQHRGGTEIVTAGTGAIRSYSLDGELLWSLSPMSSIAIPTPFSKFDLLYVASGYVGDQVRPVYAIRPGAKGDISLKPGETSSASIAWSLPQGGPYNPSPIVYGDYYYTLFDRGFFTCHDAKTGKEIYTKVRLDPTAGAFTASPWAYNGKIFAMSEDGVTYVIEAGPRIQDRRTEHARRILDGVTGDPSRQPDHSDGNVALSNRQPVGGRKFALEVKICRAQFSAVDPDDPACSAC